MVSGEHLRASVMAERTRVMKRHGPGARREVMVVVGSKVSDVWHGT